MLPQTSLRICAFCYITLGIMVFCVLWLAPHVGVPLSQDNPKPTDVITTARGWGDINGTMFIGLGMIFTIASYSVESESKSNSSNNIAIVQKQLHVLKSILLGNLILSIILLGFATFHTVVLHHGPPPPVFIAVITNTVVSYLGRKSEPEKLNSAKKKK